MSNKFFSNPLNVVMIVVLVVLIVGLVLGLIWKPSATVPNARNCQLIAQSCLLKYPNDEAAFNKCIRDVGCPVI